MLPSDKRNQSESVTKIKSIYDILLNTSNLIPRNVFFLIPPSSSLLSLSLVFPQCLSILSRNRPIFAVLGSLVSSEFFFAPRGLLRLFPTAITDDLYSGKRKRVITKVPL